MCKSSVFKYNTKDLQQVLYLRMSHFKRKQGIQVVPTTQVRFQRKPIEAQSSIIPNSISKGVTNISFEVKGGFNKFISFISPNKSNKNIIHYVLGGKFPSQREVKQQIQKIIWFSYRDIQGIIPGVESDVGWGCLIRVGQMAFAAALKRFYRAKFPSYQQRQLKKEIISAFLDQRQSRKSQKYSLTKIVEAANQSFGLKYGQWFNSSQICSTLAYLHTKSPLNGTDGLKVVYFPNTIIYLDEIYKNWNKNLCNCGIKRIGCRNCSRSSMQTMDTVFATYQTSQSIHQRSMRQPVYQQYRGNQTYDPSYLPNNVHNTHIEHILVFVTTRLGMNSVGKKQYLQLIELLKISSSLGVVGGIPKKGMYIVGSVEDKLYYLDPHYVQKYVALSNYEAMAQSFIFPDARTLTRDDLDPSMAFAFYISNQQQLSELYDKIEDLKSYENNILGVEWYNPYKCDEESYRHEDDLESVYSDLDNSFIE